MKRTTVVAMGLLCLIALKPSSLIAEEKSVESAKADSGLRFLESGKGQSGVGEPSAVRAAAAPSHASGLTGSIVPPRLSGSRQVPVPVPSGQNDAWATYKADECAKSNSPRAASFGAAVGTVIGAIAGLFVGVGALPGAVGGSTAGAIVAGVTTVMICREANGIPAFGSQ